MVDGKKIKRTVNDGDSNESDPVSSDSSDNTSDYEDDSGGDSDVQSPGSDDTSENESNDEENEEDALIKAIRERQARTSNKPPSITNDDAFVDMSFHPSEDIICMGCVSGNIHVYSYSVEGNTLKGEVEIHLKVCRAVEFSNDGQTIFSAGRDKVIAFTDLNTLDLKMFIDGAHDVPICALKVVDDNMIITGGEDGAVKIWDTRYTNKPAFMSREIQDYITGFVTKDSHKVACTSGDGTLTSFDIRSNKKLQQSESFGSDLTCCASTHNETMIVCGTSTGQYLFYKWNDFSDAAGTYKMTSKKNINTLLTLSDNIILSGMDDGIIKSFHFFPHKEIGIVGQHSLSVECLDVSHDGSLIASLSPDPVIKFWNVSYLEGFEVNIEKKNISKDGINLPSSEFDDRKSFFSGLA